MEEGQDNLVELSVSEISASVKRHIEGAFGRVRVRGELGRVARPASGHLYFDMKDDISVLAAVIWKGAKAAMAVEPETGLEVVCTGRLTTFAGQSRYQLVVEHIEPAGAGALMALLDARRRKLAEAGLFDDDRKRALPALPEIIGVVTSPSGAVIRDILHRLADRFPRHVLVWPVRVQGESCAREVADALAGFNKLGAGDVPRPDVLIVARGGGSLEDLWPFNEEIVVQAVAASEIPVISAVGHETDTTLIDLAADVRAPTPTAAAEMAVPVRAELRAALDGHAARMGRAQSRLTAEASGKLAGLARGLKRPEDVLALPFQRFDATARRLGQGLSRNVAVHRAALTRIAARVSPLALQGKMRLARQSLDTLARRVRGQAENAHARRAAKLAAGATRLRLLSHESVLQRGFALALLPDGTPLRHAAQAADGTLLDIRLAAEERLAARVEKPTEGRRRRKPATGRGNQGTLL